MMTNSTEQDTAMSGRQRFRAMAPTLAFDLLLPIAAYYLLHSAFGISDVLALTIGGLLAGLRVLYTVIRDRKVDGFALFVLVLFAVGLVLAFVTGDARFVLAKDSAGTGLAGLIILVTCVVGKPFTYYSTQRFIAGADEAKRQRLHQLYETSAAYREVQRRISVLWGVGLLVESAVRIVLIYQLPVATMVALSPLLMIVTFGGLILYTRQYVVQIAKQPGRSDQRLV